MKTVSRISGILVLFFILSCTSSSGPVSIITTGTLFQEMIDLPGLARIPDPYYRTVQFSSFDHRSTLPGGPEWFANADGFGKEPVPNFEGVLREPDDKGIGEYLIADVEGPGAVVRLWTAAISGDLNVALDGSDTPLYSGPAEHFFRTCYDTFPQIEHIDHGRFSKTIYQRDACYAPIPFARRLRVTWTGDLNTIHFYQLQVRLYEKNTPLKTFIPEDIRYFKQTIDHVTRVLSDPDGEMESPPESTSHTFASILNPGEAKDVLEITGTRSMNRFSMKLSAGDLDLALRQTVIHLHFDDFPLGQVQSPAGDFFGAAPGVNPYRSLPFSVLPDGTMVCRFVMPFEKKALVRLENAGEQPVEVTGSAMSTPCVWRHDSLHFRARWRVDHDLIASNQVVQDLPFLLANGQGVHVGTTSILLNPNNVPTPYGNWWGEGDEKIFIDDDSLPSIFGTGSEDYFNYSWSSPDIFYFPYCGQPRNDGPGNRGFVTNFRWHILDAIPFKKNIRFYMELFSHERTPGLSYARIAYHYARPGAGDDHLAIMPADVRPLSLPENWQPAARMGARDSRFFQAEDIITRRAGTERRRGSLWAGGEIRVWKPEAIGEQKDFRFRISERGLKRIHFVLALTPQSGEIECQLDGQPVKLSDDASSINLYRSYRVLLRNFTLKEMELEEGNHTLTFVYRGVQEEVSTPEVGVDFIWIQDRNR